MISNVIANTFAQLGDFKFESNLYELLLKNKQPTITFLAEKLQVHRDKIYKSMDKLELLGLIQKESDYSREIFVEPPATLFALLKHKRSQTDQILESFETVLPEMQTNYNNIKKHTTVKLYQGQDSFVQIFDKFIEEAQDEILCYCNPSYFHEIVSVNYLRMWIERRLKKNLKIRIISTKNTSEEFELFESKDKLRQIKFLPENIDFKGTFYLVGSKIVTWNPVLPKAVAIEDIVIAQTYRSMFEFIWETLYNHQL